MRPGRESLQLPEKVSLLAGVSVLGAGGGLLAPGFEELAVLQRCVG